MIFMINYAKAIFVAVPRSNHLSLANPPMATRHTPEGFPAAIKRESGAKPPTGLTEALLGAYVLKQAAYCQCCQLKTQHHLLTDW